MPRRDSKIRFSIIIVSYNTAALTAACVSSVFKFFPAGKFEVIVVDNGSDDGSARILDEEFGGRITLLANSGNSGFGAANNLAAARAGGEFLFFLNSDTIITRDILGPLEKACETEARPGALAPALLLENGRRQEHAYGSFPGLWSLLLRRKEPEPAFSGRHEVDWVSGAALAVKRELFEALGGFDESFFMYYEDMDLCRRIRDAGYANMVLPDISLIHLGGRSQDDSPRKKQYYESQTYYFRKHHGRLAAFLVSLLRFFYRRLN